MDESGEKIFPISELKLLELVRMAISSEQTFCSMFWWLMFFGGRNKSNFHRQEKSAWFDK